jgi:hypothetical protein
MLRKNIFVRCGKLLEDDTSGDGLPLAGSTVCCKYVPEASNRSRSVRRNCAANFLAESGLSVGGRLLLLGEPGILVGAIFGRRIADVDQAHVSMNTRADIVG